MTEQSIPRRSIAKQAAVARRLNASASIAPHILESPVEYESEKRVIRCRCRAKAEIVAGDIALVE